MSRIDELIQQLCPDGVEYKPLGEVCDLKAGKSISANQISEKCENSFCFPCWGGNGMRGYVKGYSHKGQYPIIGRQGALCGNVSFALGAFYATEHAIVVSCHLEFIPRFLFHLLVKMELNQYATGGAQPGLSVNKLNLISVPVPSLPVQEEIVRILDKFTALEAELEAELEARRKQYEYYRDQLLTFGDEVEWKPLGEVCVNASNIRWSENQDQLFRYIDLSSVDRDSHKITNASEITFETAPSRAQQIVQENDILFGMTRPLLKRFCIISPKYSGQICSTGFCVLRPKQKVVLSQWIYHQISLQRFYDYVEKHQKGASYPAIADKDVKLYKIPVPPLAEQERIVRILDKFDALVNDISSGLPAELEMRRKQYEYYRDKLLTFKPIAKEA